MDFIIARDGTKIAYHIRGEGSIAPAKRSEEMHYQIKNSELLIIPDASHNIVQEEAGILTSRILEFLEKH